MRNLDAINPKDMRPSKFVGICACLPIILGVVSLPLAYGAAPDIPIVENPLAHLPFLILTASSSLALMAFALKWDWKTKYYGLSLLFGLSISLFAVIPLLALMLYGTASVWSKMLVLLFYVFSHALWCRKYLLLYKDAFENKILRPLIYQEDEDAVYYMQRGDRFLLEKYYKFAQMPRGRHFLLFIILALALVPVMGSVKELSGIPFAHAFLLVGMIPISWMSFGFALRGYLIYYHYPSIIKKTTGKEVYVDLATAPPSLDSKTMRASKAKKIKL